jgi:hypothetical protein
MRVFALLIGTIVGTASPSAAATLEVISGKVSVNSGQGFKQVSGLVTVNPGDKVLVEGGSANLLYDGTCSMNVGGGARSIATVAAAAPCTANSPVASLTSPAAGYVLPVLGVAGLGVGAAVALSNTDNKKSSPSSP